ERLSRRHVYEWTHSNTNEHAYPAAIHSILTSREVSGCEGVGMAGDLLVSKRYWSRRTFDEKQQQFVT
ncbi:unnamed protein product, partial [Ectocarpus sp. 12 AP-2014]